MTITPAYAATLPGHRYTIRAGEMTVGSFEFATLAILAGLELFGPSCPANPWTWEMMK